MAGQGPTLLEPDGPMYAHSLPGFADLRVLDAEGRQVPWREAPRHQASPAQPVQVLNSGSQDGQAVALLDLGAQRWVHDRALLDIPERSFTGRAEVLGADLREGPFTRLSSTEIYDIRGGARPARSTVAVFPPSDFRYLMLRASGVGAIAGATVSGAAERPVLIRRDARDVSRRERGTRSVITIDLGYRNLPVDELRIEVGTPRYERPVTLLGSNDGRHYVTLTTARISRLEGSRSAPLAVAGRHRYLRLEIENGSDEPLAAVRITPYARSRALVLEESHSRPHIALYGNPTADSPDYDFARLPQHALELDRAMPGRLGAERVNPAYEPPPDTRSFSARHPAVITAALVLAAIALGTAGFIALRSRPSRG